MKKSLKDYAALELDGQKWVRETPLHRAAPELLEALKEAQRYLAYLAGETDGQFFGGGMPKDALAQARAAIAKAEGKTE